MVAGEGTTCMNPRTSQACWTRATPPRSRLFLVSLGPRLVVNGVSSGGPVGSFCKNRVCAASHTTERCCDIPIANVLHRGRAVTCQLVAVTLQSPVRLSLRCKSCTATLHVVTCRDMRVSEDISCVRAQAFPEVKTIIFFSSAVDLKRT